MNAFPTMVAVTTSVLTFLVACTVHAHQVMKLQATDFPAKVMNMEKHVFIKRKIAFLDISKILIYRR